MPLPLVLPESANADPEPIPLREAYRTCEEIARRHYENFPITSRFISSDRRLALVSIYAFARQADDLADAEAPTAERLRALSRVEDGLLRALEGSPQGPIFTALADAVERHRLPAEPLIDLLTAFRADARNATFPTWDDLLTYCRGSANPIGRLVLALHGIEDPAALRESDALCTALQLTNFWQDLGPDLARGRLFLPLEDLRRFGLKRDDLTRPALRPVLSRLLAHECRATEDLFRRGLPVVRRVPFALSVHLRAAAGGGRAILRTVERWGWRVLKQRPALGRTARARLLLLSLLGLDG